MTFYPIGYGTELVTLGRLRAETYPTLMHPVYADRLFAWIEAQGGKVGIGGSWRRTQPDKPGFAPAGKSFHQTQQFPSGPYFAAVDLVVEVPGQRHRAPTWDEVPEQGSRDAELWRLHCNVPGEPWHMQPIELDGWQTWVNAGRPDLEERSMPAYIATPPPEYRNPHRGSFLCIGASVRYCTTPDVQWALNNNVQKIELDADQYALLYRNVFGVLP